MYYVCNGPDSMEVPRGGGVTLFSDLTAAQQEALRKAQQQPSNLSWYVHEFGPSTVVFRASSVVTIESEVLNEPPLP